ncbi:LysR substrate-binding domain-containing protein [Azospirillum doebereinerae]|uniref:LysR family transcriptional regulator n=1 Tax=Azospirillum doebereinerae TaxID=92933 RepID=A0A433J321_9PROT|nr:LysR substrate-binding domain-containing protein [Azospirillum doebereinerae]MCG5242436.1 LysR substrate-binding domain-containing protein [Azospirillum doebereinerae]RUQ66103.1 LysR family transcriptional regulator [Azospirillum doebereinerae]
MTLPDLDIDALRAFVTVAEAGGFTAAAERLGRTQSAISVKIKKLEDTLGRRLFERTSRSLSVTHDGELLLGYARRLLELNDETVRRFAEPAAEGELRLGVAEYFLSDHLPRVLTQFAKIYPRLHIDVRVGLCGDLVGGLDSGELDLVISRRDPGETRGRGIWREPMRWVAAPTLELAPDAPLPFCALPAPCVFRNRGLAALGEIGRPWRVVYTSASVMGVQAAVRAGLGVAVLSESSVPDGARRLGAEDGLPDLGEVEMAIFGETPRNRRLAEPLVGFILESLSAMRPARPVLAAVPQEAA